MDYRSAYIDLRMGENSEGKPLILEQVLFCPVLTWVCKELLVRGVRRFFVVCDASWKEETERALLGIARERQENKDGWVKRFFAGKR